MRSEKYIKNNLNHALDDIAPDVLTNILAMDRVETDSMENDLRDESLFLDEVVDNRIQLRKRMGVLAAVVMLMVIMCATFIPKLAVDTNKVHCTITLDINPSINIYINEEGQVIKVDANNNDGTKIAKQIDKKITEEYYTEDAVGDLVSKLKKAGYLDKKKVAMLISSDKSYEGSSKGIKNARKAINKYKRDNKDEFVAVYQEYTQSKKVDKIAEKNGISVAKAAYCIKISQKTDESCDELCKESISKITSRVVTDHIDLGEEIMVVEEIETFEEETEAVVEETMEELSTVEEISTSESTGITTVSEEMESGIEIITDVEETKNENGTAVEGGETAAVQETTAISEKVTETATQ